MNKKLILGGISVLMAMTAMAIPAKQGLREIRLPDGTSIQIRLTGDERFNQRVTSDGLPVKKSTDGFYYYQTLSGMSGIKANDPGRRSAAEIAFIESNSSELNIQSIRANALKSQRANSPVMKGAGTQVPNQGSPRVPVLLVQYKDKKFKDADPKTVFKSFCSEGPNSAYQYFVDQSNGKYTPEFDIYGPYTLPNNRVYYGGNDWYGNDERVGEMVALSCIGLDSEIQYSDYDNDGDGECDVVLVIYAGDGEASSYEDDAEDAVWPCQWNLAKSDYGKDIRLDNTKISKFAVFNELYGADLSKIDGIGTFCHEFSHCLGLPDFYDTQYGNHFGMGSWSLMDYGSYNNDGYTPLGYSAYEKNFMGWIDIEEGKPNRLYTLPIFNSKDIEKDMAVKLTSDNDPNEYFILENRQKQGWDAYMPSQGLFIYHVTYDATIWSNNKVNDYDMQRMTPVPADNRLKVNADTYGGYTYYQVDEADMKGDLWPYAGNNAFTDTSKPAASLNSGGMLGKPVTEITQNADGTVSFYLMKGFKSQVGAPSLTEHNIGQNGEVTFNWTYNDDPEVTYTLEVKEYQGAEEVLNEDFSKGLPEWPKTGYVAYEASEEAVRFGSSNQAGTMTSGIVETDGNGKLTIKINGRYYSNDQSKARITLLSATDAILVSKDVDLTSAFEDHTVMLQSPSDQKVKIKISTTAAKKRFYLKSLVAYSGEAIETRAIEEPEIRVYKDLTDTSHTVSDLRVGVTYSYRVKAVPTDTENFTESNWSPSGLVTANGGSGVEEIIDNPELISAEYYTLDGVKVARISEPGVYIERRGEKTRKLIVR